MIVPLCDQLMNRLCTFGPDKSLIEAAEEVTQTIWVETKLLQYRRMNSFHVSPFFNSLGTEFIRFAVADTTLDASTCHPHRKAVCVVIATGSLCVFGGWLTTEFSAPYDPGLVQHAAVF